MVTSSESANQNSNCLRLLCFLHQKVPTQLVYTLAITTTHRGTLQTGTMEVAVGDHHHFPKL